MLYTLRVSHMVAKCSLNTVIKQRQLKRKRMLCKPVAVYRLQSISLSRMASSGMLRLVALVITDVSEEPSASFIRVTIGELGTQRASVDSCS
jgi:hypothetical protein